MQLNYPISRFDKIPEEVKKMDSQDLDFTDDNPQREIHKLELDRRIFYGTDFLPEYTWDGRKKDGEEDDLQEERGLSRWT